MVTRKNLPRTQDIDVSQVLFVLVLVLVCGGGHTSLLLPYTSRWKGGGDTVRGKVVVAWKGGSDTSRRWTLERKISLCAKQNVM